MCPSDLLFSSTLLHFHDLQYRTILSSLMSSNTRTTLMHSAKVGVIKIITAEDNIFFNLSRFVFNLYRYEIFCKRFVIVFHLLAVVYLDEKISLAASNITWGKYCDRMSAQVNEKRS